MKETLKLPSPRGNERFVPVPGHPGYAVADDGTFWTCWRSKRNGKSGSVRTCQDVANWRPIEVRSSRERSYAWVRLSGSWHSAAHIVLAAFSQERPTSQHVVLYADGERTNLALSNLSWVKRNEKKRGPSRGRAQKYLTGRNLDWRMRKCLTCSEEFESWGPGNRRCPRCDDRMNKPAYRSAREEPVKISV